MGQGQVVFSLAPLIGAILLFIDVSLHLCLDVCPHPVVTPVALLRTVRLIVRFLGFPPLLRKIRKPLPIRRRWWLR
jgi:hypothetical protein